MRLTEQEEESVKESPLRTNSKALALHVIEVCDTVDTRKGRGVLVNQIIRCATSVGANIHEASYGASRADFINKLQTALKECIETEYWIELLAGSGCIAKDAADKLMNECGIIHRMLVKSLTTAKSVR